MKSDITKSLQSVDRLLASSSLTPLQRHYLQVYKRHSLSEVVRLIDKIFEPAMMVDEPHYRIQLGGTLVELKGREAVRGFYDKFGGSVILHEDQVIHLSEQSFTYCSTLVQHVTGAQVVAMGRKADPTGHYVRRSEGAVALWTFDKRGRLTGEFGSDMDSEFIQIPADEFISPQEAREKLIPLIIPLPEFNPDQQSTFRSR